jgi:hypothetical protein
MVTHINVVNKKCIFFKDSFLLSILVPYIDWYTGLPRTQFHMTFTLVLLKKLKFTALHLVRVAAWRCAFWLDVAVSWAVCFVFKSTRVEYGLRVRLSWPRLLGNYEQQLKDVKRWGKRKISGESNLKLGFVHWSPLHACWNLNRILWKVCSLVTNH